jgi:hypothetical protein
MGADGVAANGAGVALAGSNTPGTRSAGSTSVAGITGAPAGISKNGLDLDEAIGVGVKSPGGCGGATTGAEGIAGRGIGADDIGGTGIGAEG